MVYLNTEMNKILLKIGINTGIQLAGKAISVALSIISIFMLTRYLGSTGYGIFTLAFSYVSFFSIISDFGLQLTMVRELSQKQGDEARYGSFFLLKVFLTIVATISAIGALFFFPYSREIKMAITIATFAVGISSITTYGTAIFQSRVRMDLITLIDIITKIATVACIIVFVLAKLNIYYIIACVLLGNCIGLLIIGYLLREVFYFSLDIAHIKKIIIYSIPVGISSFIGLAYFKIDTIMLSLLRNTTEVGLYSVPYKVLENVLLVWGFYMASAYPMFARFHGERKRKNMKDLLVHSLIIAFCIAIPIILCVFIFAPFIISIFAGKGFNQSTASLRILIFSIPFLFVNNLLSDVYIVVKKNTVIIMGILFSLIVNVVLNLFLIPQYGFIGASYVTVISAMVLCAYCIIITLIKRKTLFYD